MDRQWRGVSNGRPCGLGAGAGASSASASGRSGSGVARGVMSMPVAESERYAREDSEA